VQQGDYLSTIATAHGLDANTGVILIFLLNPYNSATGTGIDPQTAGIFPGQTIMLPPPDMQLPTATPWPTGIVSGTKITYFVMPGDSLGAIASKCNSTIDAIVAANPDVLTSGATTNIQPGWLLQVPVNIVTPVPTAISTATPGVTTTP
jgi:spore germination protein YaaH